MAEDINGTENYIGGPIQKPTDGDVGNEVFQILEEFMERLATHTHAGVDSKKITLNIDKDIELFEVGVDLAWADQGNNVYRAQLPLPSSATFDGNLRSFFYNDGTTWREFFPTVEAIPGDVNNYYIYSNDNTIDVRVVTL